MSEERKPTVMGAVLGKYRITGALGAGGMGSVFTAVHVETKRAAAVKVLRRELSDDEQVVERFFNEARAATRIRHPGIIEVFDFGYDSDGRAFLAMELLEGVTLRQRIAAKQVLPEDEAKQITRAVADALAAAHAAGIIHRDLKPDNIFLVAGGGPKVLDFGIAKLLDRDKDEASRTRTGSLIGTPVYMAPEQARAAGSIDARADLYSLGCILYEMLAGAPPFVGNVGELIAAHMFNEPPHVESPTLDALIQRLLAKEPADRPRDAMAVADALAPRQAVHFADERPEEAKPTRSMMPIVAAIGTLAIAAVALFFVFGRGGDDPKPPPPAAPVEVAKPVDVVAPPPSVTPIAPPVKKVEPPPPPVVVKKPRPVEHHHEASSSGPVAAPTGGPVTSPGGPVTTPTGPVATPTPDPPKPKVTPEGAPLSGEP